MGETGDRDWVRTLDEVGQAIEGCLSALDRYETKFTAMLADHVPPHTARPLPAPDDGWRDRLTVAKAGADEVERLLDEQEAVWGRWREALSAWRQLVEQPQPGERGA
jgi:hypothetical protein